MQQVVFDRGGNTYTGRVAAFADAAREAGLRILMTTASDGEVIPMSRLPQARDSGGRHRAGGDRATAVDGRDGAR